MIQALALAVVTGAGGFFALLGLAALFRPPFARRFLQGLALSPARHYTELLVRLAVGGALVLTSPALPAPAAFSFFGWVLLATTGVLFLTPWRVHHAFARAAVPRALRLLPAVGLASLAAGAVTLWAVAVAGAG